MWTDKEKLAGNIGFGLGALIVGTVVGLIAYAVGKDKGKGEIADEVKDVLEKEGKFHVGEVNVVNEVSKDSEEGKALNRDGYVVKVFLKSDGTDFVEKGGKFAWSPDKKFYKTLAEAKGN